MFFIDSWVWIEFFSKDESWKEAEEVIEKLQEEKGIISSIVLMEVKYRIRNKYDSELAEKTIHVIESFDNLTALPVTSKVATYAADLRNRYYNRGKNEISYADAVHLATADLSNCDIFFTGDPDFKDVKEVDVQIIG